PRFSFDLKRRNGTMPVARHRSKRNRKLLRTNRSARFQFSAIGCIVVAAIVSFAAFSNVLAQQCSSIDISGNAQVGTCPSQVTQGRAGVSQGAALGNLSLLTATSNATNTNIGLHLASL